MCCTTHSTSAAGTPQNARTFRNRAIWARVQSVHLCCPPSRRHDQLVRLPVWPAPYTHSGKVEKEGDVKWSARWACIVNARLYVFRDHSQVEHSRPLNVIPIIDAVVDKKGTRQFSVEIEARHFNFRCENEETTDAWIKELLRVKRDPYPPPADRRRKKK